ncbi:MAG: TetR/AcrR family transcriptional regulator [Micromonosporaceae bacterium]
MSEEVPTEIPTPPWHRPARAAAVRPVLSQDGIVEAALRLLDTEGLDAISMRRVAQELGTGVASLYVHVAHKEQLLQLLLDRIYGEVSVPAPDPARWQEQLKEFARELRGVLRRHRDIAKITFGPMPVGPKFVVVMEDFLALLDAGGVPPKVAAATGDILSLYAQAFALEESASYSEGAKQDGQQIRDYLTSLPPQRFPHLLGLVSMMSDDNADERFELGLDLLVRGIVSAR